MKTKVRVVQANAICDKREITVTDVAEGDVSEFVEALVVVHQWENKMLAAIKAERSDADFTNFKWDFESGNAIVCTIEQGANG